jgi:organic hydroperoxide reductase OsmC/OhrA
MVRQCNELKTRSKDAHHGEGAFRPCAGRIRDFSNRTEGTVSGIDTATFEKTATEAKENCPVSKALKAVEITLTARLV